MIGWLDCGGNGFFFGMTYGTDPIGGHAPMFQKYTRFPASNGCSWFS